MHSVPLPAVLPKVNIGKIEPPTASAALVRQRQADAKVNASCPLDRHGLRGVR